MFDWEANLRTLPSIPETGYFALNIPLAEFGEQAGTEGTMAHPKLGGYVITARGRKKHVDDAKITVQTLQQIASDLGVNDMTEIRTIFVYAPVDPKESPP